METNTPVVVSYYTRNSLYEKEAELLLASCQKYGIECSIEGVESHGSWEHNCALKPAFILHKIRQLKRPVIWVDADAQFKQPPDWRPFLPCDIAIRSNPHFHKEHPSRLMTGTMYFNYTPATLHLLVDWQTACEHQLIVSPQEACSWDQMVLAQVLEKHAAIQVGTLPLSYVCVRDWDEGLVSAEEKVIEHTQLSRTTQKHALQDLQDIVEKWNLGGIIDYQPSMMREIGDCIYAFFPFLCSSVVVMDNAYQLSQKERQEFAFLARLFSFMQFVEISTPCSLEKRLFIASQFMKKSIDRCIAIQGNQIADHQEMLTFLKAYKPSPKVQKKSTEELPAFFKKESIQQKFVFGSSEEESKTLFKPWSELASSVNFLLHPHYEDDHTEPSNLIKMDESQIAALQHLGLIF